MAITLLNELLRELDKYVRKAYVQHVTDVPPDFPIYTKEEPWPKNGSLLAPFIRNAQFTSIGPAAVKPENVAITPQHLRDGRTKDVYSVRFATAVAFSHEKTKMGADVYSSAKKPGQFLADAQRLTYETYYAGFFTHATNASAPPELLGFDERPLLSATHVLMGSTATASNLRSTAGSITYSVLNEVMTAVTRTVSEDNVPMPILRVNELWVPPEEEANAYETITSMGRPDTANRADNVLAQRLASSLTKDSVKVLVWMPATHWYAVDKTKHSLTRYALEAPQITGPIKDELKESYMWKVTFWISRAFWDWRGVYGVPRP